MAKLNRTTFLGSIEKGVLVVRNRATMAAEIKKYDDCATVIKIERLKNSRSKNQNSYYWGVVLDTIANDTGHTQEELHAIFKKMFLPKIFKKIGSKTVMISGSTTALSTDEFARYIDRIIAEAGGMGISIAPAEGGKV
jgi:hypothetical protein